VCTNPPPGSGFGAGDAVIPQVRSESIAALRTVADKLRDLADRFDQTPPPPKDASRR
jgi:hypothetical protein